MRLSEETIKHGIIWTPWKEGEERTPRGLGLQEIILEHIGLEEDHNLIPELPLNHGVQAKYVEGFFIHTKSLKFHCINKADWGGMLREGVKQAGSFRELEELLESMKHRFANKKFGL